VSLKGHNILTSPFPELVAMPAALTTNSPFDIIIEEEINLQNYCTALLQKIFDLPQSQFPAFVNYQCNQVKEPVRWLNKFEKLLANNEQIFTSKQALSRYNKLYNLIEQKRKEVQSTSLKDTKVKTPKRLINADAEDRYFSFHEVKNYTESLDTFSEKIMYLTEEIYEYKQADIISINNKLQAYDMQCQQQIEKLQTMKRMRTEFEKELLEKTVNGTNQSTSITKIQLNGPINIITNAFKQMMNNIKPNGKPYIQYKIKDIAQFICDNFVDENGQALSQATVQTYLSPNRTDKDPNNDSAVKL
jgi:hypothetical protein